MSGRIVRAVLAGVVGVLLLAGCTSAPNSTTGGGHGSAVPTTPLPAGALGPNPGVAFAWVGDPARPLPEADLRTVADNNDVAVLTAWNDNYDLAENVREMRTLKALNPRMRVYLYYNASLFPTRIRGPYLPGFDASTMALHDQSGQLVTHGANAQFPDGTAVYVDTTSPAYQRWALDAVTSTVKLGYAGVVLDSYNGLVLGDRQSQYWANKIGGDKVTAWDAGLFDFGHQLADRLGRDRVVYNGISPTLAGQVDRNLAHLSYLGGAVNEEFCVMYPKPEVDHVAQDVQIMQSSGAGLLLEHVNPGGAGSQQRIDELNSFCYAAFLIGYRPGSSYFLSSVTYRADQLYSLPADVHLQLGDPVATAVQAGDGVYTRRFAHGLVLLNLTDHDRTLSSPVSGVLARDGRGLGSVRVGGSVTVPGESALYVYSG